MTGRGCSATGARNQRGASSPVRPFRYVLLVTVLLGYARVSTAEQNADLQTDELTSAGCYEVFVDHASGVLDRRPELEKVLERLPCCGRPASGQVGGVWSATRISVRATAPSDRAMMLSSSVVNTRRSPSRSL